VPIPAADLYFNTAPVLLQDEQIALSVGSTSGFQMVAFSSGPTPSWLVAGADDSDAQGNPLGVLTFTPSDMVPSNAQNGQTIPLRITLDKTPPSQPGEPSGTPLFEPYLIVSVISSDAGVPIAAHYWPGIVVDQ
jgi:hypothetical protein